MLLINFARGINACVDKGQCIDLIDRVFSTVVCFEALTVWLTDYNGSSASLFLYTLHREMLSYFGNDEHRLHQLAPGGKGLKSAILRKLKINRILSFPLGSQNRPAGVLLLYQQEETPENSSDTLLLIEALNAIISLALINSIAYANIGPRQNLHLNEEIASYNGEMVGTSPSFQQIGYLIAKVAPSDTTVLITGETGTGKELTARAIHESSKRAGQVMIKVNCAAIPANLLESELFGHEKGSFTGANERIIGKFELAKQGTLFLDEIGDLSLELQAKLLRVLQEKEFQRIGGSEIIKTDVRVISATNRNLQIEVKEARFRSDLFYRLNVFPIHLPPLRERKADIPNLVNHFIQKLSTKLGNKICGIAPSVLADLLAYPWPGNIRELEHVMERSMLMAHGDTITDVFLPDTVEDVQSTEKSVYKLRSFAENERNYIMYVLQVCSGKINGPGGAASVLGVPASTLHSKIKKYKIPKLHLKP